MIFLILFIVISILNFIFEIKGNKKGRYFTKPFLVPLLILFYLFSVSTPNYYILLALMGGFIGDVFLMWPEKQTFVLSGISAFLLGHVFYIILFLTSTQFLKEVHIWFYFLLIPYIVLGIYLARKLYPSMKTMKFPATIYISVLYIMSFTSLTRIFEISYLLFILPFIGSLFFIISDTILAFDMFKIHKKYNDVYVMSTYVIAQLLIVLGFVIKNQ